MFVSLCEIEVVIFTAITPKTRLKARTPVLFLFRCTKQKVKFDSEKVKFNFFRVKLGAGKVKFTAVIPRSFRDKVKNKNNRREGGLRLFHLAGKVPGGGTFTYCFVFNIIQHLT
jgi:hypothetical protein